MKQITIFKSLLLAGLMSLAGVQTAFADYDGNTFYFKGMKWGCPGVGSDVFNNALNLFPYGGLNNSGWGGSYTHSEYPGSHFGVNHFFGMNNDGSSQGPAKNIMCSYFQEPMTVPAYTKVVRTATFRFAFNSNRHVEAAGLYAFDSESAATGTYVDMSHSQNQTKPAGHIGSIVYYGYTQNKWEEYDCGTVNLAFDNSAGSSKKDVSKWYTFVQVSSNGNSGGSNGHEYAQWRMNYGYTDKSYYYNYVTFDANGGTGTMNNAAVGSDAAIPANEFTHERGYKVVGWNTQADGQGTSYDLGATISVTESTKGPMTLYAQWSNSVCKINDVEYGSVQAAVNAATDGQTIKMIANSAEDVTIASGKTVTLDLNGKVLKGTGTTSVVYVDTNGNLTINDSGTTAEHKFTPDDSGLWVLDETNGTKTVNGGVITGGIGRMENLEYRVGGGICNWWKLTLNGGNIVGNSTAGGGGIYNGQSSDDGIIGSTFTMNGGCVYGNIGTYYGGGIGVNEKCVVKLLGGEVKYNVALEESGGVESGWSSTNPYTIGGDIVISDNTLSDRTTASNFYIYEGYTFSVGTGDEAPKTGMKVGVTTEETPTTSNSVQITQACTDAVAYFKADTSIYTIFYDQASSRMYLGGYKLTLDANGAECSTEYVRTIKGSACPTLPELTRAGFYTPGWYDTKQEKETDEVPATGKFTSGMNIDYSADKTIHCWWKLKFRDDDTSVSDGTVQVKDTNVTVTSDDATYMMEKAQKSVNVVDMTKAKNLENPSDVIDAIHNSKKLTPNTLIYLPVLEEEQSVPSDKAENVVMKVVSGEDTTYKCVNFSVTDGVPVNVLHSFNADVATYRRDTSSRWGTVCVPFKLRSDSRIQYYTSGKLIGEGSGAQLLWEKADTVAAGCPAVYMVSDIDTSATGGATATKKDIVKTDYVKVVGTSASESGTSVKLVGTYTELVLDNAKVTELNIGSQDIYYYKDNKFYKRAENQTVTIPALRAYILIPKTQQQ